MDPTGQTNPRDIEKAASGGFVPGRPQDVQALQLAKSGDLRDAVSVRDDLAISLSFVFLLNSAVRRSGERVTAEEIREVAREIEDSFGGTYTILRQDLQMGLVRRYERLAEADNRLEPLPKDITKPVIVTGLESIGRSHELTKLQLFAGDLASYSQLDPEAVRHLDTAAFVEKLATAHSLASAGVVRDPDVVAQEIHAESQAAKVQALIERLGPNAINQLGNAQQSQPAEPTTP